ncbi:hypothetical protein SAMN04487881_1831 [Marinobacter sp. es.048]|uniref:hypothetical protein n=1 Tax=Marinobacter sp. es.048 TaxID=1761795 RepID=UPI000B589F5D|nr:hypothetical protein [Marinobacter sp. es.048]SNC67107.1 hypothetical protein SAMN04487881_1831 [Marinobacter sp. es.048]
MALKDSLRLRFEKLADDVVPQLLDSWGGLQKRLDDLNCSLANRAVPEDRRSRVSELSLQEKAQQAGQDRPVVRAVPATGKGSRRK